jgi:hypothetical protein
MADAKMVTVKAKLRGQKPNRTWAEPGDTFEVPENKVGAWMERVEGKKAAKKAEPAEQKADD